LKKATFRNEAATILVDALYFIHYAHTHAHASGLGGTAKWGRPWFAQLWILL